MSTISFTSYVDADAGEVESRLSQLTAPVPEGAVVKIVPFVDRSQIVVTMPWNVESEAGRSATTLNAARFVRAIDRMALAA